MIQDASRSEPKAGLTRRAVIGTIAATAAVSALRGIAEAQTPPGLLSSPALIVSEQPIEAVIGTARLTPVAFTARAGHSATLLQNGLLLIVGGQQFTAAPLSGTQIFDPSNGEWFAAASLEVSRLDHAAVLLPDGRVLVSGGLHAGGRAMAGCEIYDSQTNTWSAAAPLKIARYGHTAAALPNGTVLVVGGFGTRPIAGGEIYDPARNTWKILPANA